MPHGDPPPAQPCSKKEDFTEDQARRRRLVKAILAGVPSIITLQSGAALASSSSGGRCLTSNETAHTANPYAIGPLPGGPTTRCVNGDGLGAFGDPGTGYASFKATDPKGVIGTSPWGYKTINVAGQPPGRWKLVLESNLIDLNGDFDTNDACILYVRLDGSTGTVIDLYGAGGVNDGPPGANFYPMTASCWGSMWTP